MGHFQCVQERNGLSVTETTQENVTETTQLTKCDRNNACKKLVVSVTARSRHVTALYTVEEKPPTPKQLHRNNAHRFCLFFQSLLKRNSDELLSKGRGLSRIEAELVNIPVGGPSRVNGLPARFHRSKQASTNYRDAIQRGSAGMGRVVR